MPRYVHVPTNATSHLIRQAYDAGGPYQWAREAWRNSDESSASRIDFDVEPQAATRAGVLRRVIIDNGDGMAPDDMKDFLTTFGGGGKPIGVDSNFGQGFKSSVLPWNPYGVVVISYTEQHPDGAMLWIERDHLGNYRLREWEVPDEDGEVVVTDLVAPFADPTHNCDWSLIRPEWLKTGTIMVLLGDSPTADTIEGDPDPARAESAKGLLRYLNSRLLEVPERSGKKVSTTLVVLERIQRRTQDRRASKDNLLELPTGESLAIHQRKVNGTRHFIPTSAKSGQVLVDDHGTMVEWFFVPEPEPPVNGSADYIGQRPVVVVDYQGEAYHADGSVHRYRQFGVTDEIRGRTWLIVRPPVYSDQRPGKWGVLTQASRNMLMARGGTELPWEAWGDSFYNSFPEELAKARDDARKASVQTDDPNLAKNLNRILDRLNPRYKASRLVTSALGKIVGFAASGTAPIVHTTGTRSTASADPAQSPGRSKAAELALPADGGPTKAKEAQIRAGYPSFEWKDFDSDALRYLADYNPKDQKPSADGQVSQGVVYLNVKHPVFVQEFTYWSNEVWPKVDPREVVNLVKNVYGQEAVAHVVHAQRLSGTVVGRDAQGAAIRLSNNDVKAMLTKEALSAAMLGLVNVEQWIQTQGGGSFGKRSKA